MSALDGSTLWVAWDLDMRKVRLSVGTIACCLSRSFYIV